MSNSAYLAPPYVYYCDMVYKTEISKQPNHKDLYVSHIKKAHHLSHMATWLALIGVIERESKMYTFTYISM